MNELSWQWVVLLLGVLGIICYFAKSTLEMFLFRPKVNNNPQGPLMGPPQPGIEEKAMQEYKKRTQSLQDNNIIEDMNKYGFFHIWLLGHNFYIEVFPILANRYRDQYLQMQANSTLVNVRGNEAIYELSDIRRVDFFMQRFNS